MKSIVTGGAGFIGSHLVDRLVKMGHKVIVLDNFSTGRKSNLSHHAGKNVKIVKVDISENRKLDKYFEGVHYVFHLAGIADIVPSIENPHKYFKYNVIGTENIIKAANNQKIKKFIYAASASCYGNSKELPTSEKADIDILSPYALTKWLGEQLVLHWVKRYNLSAISLRFFNVYGPRSNNSGSYSAVINIFIKLLK